MSESQNLNAEIATLKELYAAITRNDPQAAIKLFDPEIFRLEFEGSPSAGVYRGLDEMLKNLTVGRAGWAEGSCTPERFITVGKAIIVHAHVLVRLKDSEKWIDAYVPDGYFFRNGRILEMHSFISEQKALDWANSKV